MADHKQPRDDDQKKQRHKFSVSDIINSVKRNKTIWVGQPTTPFLDDFVKKEQIGQAGQYGVVYRCQRKSDGAFFAVKYLNKNRFYRIHKDHRHKYLQAMCDEIDILKTLDHENIISLKAVYEDKSTLYLVMEQCFGGELFHRIAQRKRFTERAAGNVLKQILSALRYCHEDNNIVHCDLKPGNILFLSDSEDSPIKLIDFGMSKILPRLQHLSQVCGTPYYNAPEVIQHTKYNHCADLWSVGVILYVMIYGYPPFYADPKKYGKNHKKAVYHKTCKGFQSVIKNTSKYGYGPWFPDHIKTSPEVKDLISKLLTKQVRKRYTAKEALCHPFITDNVDNNDLHKHMVSRLVNFNNVCQFRLVISRLFRLQFYKMRPEHFQQLQQLFIKFDTKKDGVLSYEEFEAAIDGINDLNISKQHLHQIYGQLCRDDSKVPGIQFSDLLNALVYDYLVSCDERLYDAFRKLDDDNDGKITTKQLQQKLKEIDPLGEWDKAMKVIEEQSFDQNGVIDYEEFLLNLHPNFEETPEWMPDLFKKMPSITLGENNTSHKPGKHSHSKHKHSKKHRKSSKHNKSSTKDVDVNGNTKKASH